jgi:hypothetical protein
MQPSPPPRSSLTPPQRDTKSPREQYGKISGSGPGSGVPKLSRYTVINQSSGLRARWRHTDGGGNAPKETEAHPPPRPRVGFRFSPSQPRYATLCENVRKRQPRVTNVSGGCGGSHQGARNRPHPHRPTQTFTTCLRRYSQSVRLARLCKMEWKKYATIISYCN